MIAGPRTDERTTRAPSSMTTRPSMVLSTTSPSTRGSSTSSTRRLASSMSSRRPVSFHQPVTSCGSTVRPRVDQVLDRVGDLQLAAPRRPDRPGRLHDRRREHVDADQGQVAARLGRLLGQPHHPAVLQLGHAVRLRVGHALEQDHRVAGPGAEAVDQLGDAVAQEVVAEVHDERRAGQELLGGQHGVGEAQGRLLADVGDAQPERRPVADRRLDLGVRVADHDADVGHPRRAQRVEAVEEDRAVGHRHELLGARVGDRPQPRPRAPGEDQTLQRGRHAGQGTTGLCDHSPTWTGTSG